MPYEAWTIGVFYKMNSNASATLGRDAQAATRAERAMGRYSKSVDGASGAAERLAARQERIGKAFQTGFAAVGIAAAAAMGVGIQGAAKLQDAMIQTGLAAKLTAGQMAHFHGVALRMSQTTAQSVSDSMDLLRTLATSGINKPKELEALAMPIARFADTQYLGKNHVAFDTSAAMAAKVAHLLGERTAAELTPVLDQLYKMSNDMPDSIALAANQLKQFAPFFKQAGVSDQTILNLQATADRLGMGGGYGGTGFAQLLNVVRNPSKKAFRAQERLGLIDEHGGSRFLDRRTGTFDPLKLFQYVNQQRHNASYKRDFDNEVQKAFQTQNARRVLALFSSDAGLKQYQGVIDQQRGMDNVQQAQEKLMGTLNSQTKQLITNFATLASELAFPWLDNLTAPVKKLAQIFGDLATYFQQHPIQAKVSGGVVGVLGIAGGVVVGKKLGSYAGVLLGRGEHGMKIKPYVGHTAKHWAFHEAEHSAVGSRRIGSLIEGGLDALTFGSSRRMLGGALKGIGKVMPGLSGDFFKLIGSDIGRRLSAQFRAFTPIIDRLGLAIMKSRAFTIALAEGLAKFGLKAIPVVGEILMLVDTVKFLGAHAKDIGKGIGLAAAWIVDHGAPMLFDAFKSTITFIFNGIKDTLLGLFNGGHGGLWDLFKNVAGSASDAYKAQYAKDHPGVVPDRPGAINVLKNHATIGPYAGANSIKSSQVPISPPTLITDPLHALPAPQARGPRLHAANGVHIQTVAINVTVKGGDAKSMGRDIAEQTHRALRSIAGRSGDNPTSTPTVSRISFGHAAGAYS